MRPRSRQQQSCLDSLVRLVQDTAHGPVPQCPPAGARPLRWFTRFHHQSPHDIESTAYLPRFVQRLVVHAAVGLQRNGNSHVAECRDQLADSAYSPPLLCLRGHEVQLMGAVVGSLTQSMHTPLDAGTDAIPLHNIHGPLEDVRKGACRIAADRLLQHVLQDLPQPDHPVLARHPCVVDQRPHLTVQPCCRITCHVHPVPPPFRVPCSEYTTETTMQPDEGTKPAWG